MRLVGTAVIDGFCYAVYSSDGAATAEGLLRQLMPLSDGGPVVLGPEYRVLAVDAEGPAPGELEVYDGCEE